MYHCVICGKEINIREEGLKINGRPVCSDCLGSKPVTDSDRIGVRSLWGEPW